MTNSEQSDYSPPSDWKSRLSQEAANKLPYDEILQRCVKGETDFEITETRSGRRVRVRAQNDPVGGYAILLTDSQNPNLLMGVSHRSDGTVSFDVRKKVGNDQQDDFYQRQWIGTALEILTSLGKPVRKIKAEYFGEEESPHDLYDEFQRRRTTAQSDAEAAKETSSARILGGFGFEVEAVDNDPGDLRVEVIYTPKLPNQKTQEPDTQSDRVTDDSTQRERDPEIVVSRGSPPDNIDRSTVATGGEEPEDDTTHAQNINGPSDGNTGGVVVENDGEEDDRNEERDRHSDTRQAETNTEDTNNPVDAWNESLRNATQNTVLTDDTQKNRAVAGAFTESLLDDLESLGNEEASVRVIGSVVKGTMGSQSDIDVVVINDGPGLAEVLLAKGNVHEGTAIDIKAIRPSEFIRIAQEFMRSDPSDEDVRSFANTAAFLLAPTVRELYGHEPDEVTRNQRREVFNVFRQFDPDLRNRVIQATQEWVNDNIQPNYEDPRTQWNVRNTLEKQGYSREEIDTLLKTAGENQKKRTQENSNMLADIALRADDKELMEQDRDDSSQRERTDYGVEIQNKPVHADRLKDMTVAAMEQRIPGAVYAEFVNNPTLILQWPPHPTADLTRLLSEQGLTVSEEDMARHADIDDVMVRFQVAASVKLLKDQIRNIPEELLYSDVKQRIVNGKLLGDPWAVIELIEAARAFERLWNEHPELRNAPFDLPSDMANMSPRKAALFFREIVDQLERTYEESDPAADENHDRDFPDEEDDQTKRTPPSDKPDPPDTPKPPRDPKPKDDKGGPAGGEKPEQRDDDETKRQTGDPVIKVRVIENENLTYQRIRDAVEKETQPKNKKEARQKKREEKELRKQTEQELERTKKAGDRLEYRTKGKEPANGITPENVREEKEKNAREQASARTRGERRALQRRQREIEQAEQLFQDRETLARTRQAQAELEQEAATQTVDSKTKKPTLRQLLRRAGFPEEKIDAFERKVREEGLTPEQEASVVQSILHGRRGNDVVTGIGKYQQNARQRVQRAAETREEAESAALHHRTVGDRTLGVLGAVLHGTGTVAKGVGFVAAVAVTAPFISAPDPTEDPQRPEHNNGSSNGHHDGPADSRAADDMVRRETGRRMTREERQEVERRIREKEREADRTGESVNFRQVVSDAAGEIVAQRRTNETVEDIQQQTGGVDDRQIRDALATGATRDEIVAAHREEVAGKIAQTVEEKINDMLRAAGDTTKNLTQTETEELEEAVNDALRNGKDPRQAARLVERDAGYVLRKSENRQKEEQRQAEWDAWDARRKEEQRLEAERKAQEDAEREYRKALALAEEARKQAEIDEYFAQKELVRQLEAEQRRMEKQEEAALIEAQKAADAQREEPDDPISEEIEAHFRKAEQVREEKLRARRREREFKRLEDNAYWAGRYEPGGSGQIRRNPPDWDRWKDRMSGAGRGMGRLLEGLVLPPLRGFEWTIETIIDNVPKRTKKSSGSPSQKTSDAPPREDESDEARQHREFERWTKEVRERGGKLAETDEGLKVVVPKK